MISHIEHHGKLIHETNLPGERRRDNVAPAHGNGLQLSRNRFMTLVGTRGFRGVDDGRSIIWQLRRDSFSGPVIKEGHFARSIDDWYPLGDTYRYRRQYGHPVLFGVPKGARVDGPQANVFVAKWRKVGRVIDPEGHLLWDNQPAKVSAQTQCVEWSQFRLTESADDIEIIQEAQPLRQLGYDSGERFCEQELEQMNQSFVQAVPYTADGDEWVDINHFGGGRLAPLRYRFNAAKGLYEWVQTGLPIEGGYYEANLSSYGDDWLIASRRPRPHAGIGWARVSDLFGEQIQLIDSPQPDTVGSPLSVYRCPDGVTRLFTGNGTASPYDSNRNPLYLWDIDPEDGFRGTNRREVFDTFKGGIPIPEDNGPYADMGKLLPHPGGREQTLIHRVRSCAMATEKADLTAGSRVRQMTEADVDYTAIYHATVVYDQDYPSDWSFAP